MPRTEWLLIPNWSVRFRDPNKRDLMADAWTWFRSLSRQERIFMALIMTAVKEKNHG
ncbi:MAG: hypothetical protein MN733_09635 [Nitrososphaera sp.]|nr:hypothetical protein [Nitrososphaera sp.]